MTGATDMAFDDSAEGRLVVYTAVFGEGYLPPAVEQWPGVDFVCFTTLAGFTAPGWRIELVDPILPADLVRSSREQKVRPHRWLPQYRRSLYIDSSLELRQDPRIVWDALMGGSASAFFGGFRHAFRETVLDEYVVVLDEKLDVPSVVHEQLSTVRRFDPATLALRPVNGGLIARRHSDPRCVQAMESWFAQILRYSRRDQLSLAGVLAAQQPDGVHLIDADIRDNDLSGLTGGTYVRPERYRDGLVDFSRAELLDADAMRAERDQALGALNAALHERDAAVDEVRAIRASRIWRSTAGYRALRDRLGAGRRHRRPRPERGPSA